MTYNPNIPAARTRIDQTFHLITNNFNQADLIFGSLSADGGSSQGDHVGFDNATTTNRGKHVHSRYIEQAAAPITAANECGVYTKVGSNPAESNLFIRGESNGLEYQLSRLNQASSSLFGAFGAFATGQAGYTGQGGWSFLPGNMYLQYGLITGPFGATGSIAFNYPIPFTTRVFSVQVTAAYDAGPIVGFTIFEPSNQANTSTFGVAWAKMSSTGNTPPAMYFTAVGI